MSNYEKELRFLNFWLTIFFIMILLILSVIFVRLIGGTKDTPECKCAENANMEEIEGIIENPVLIEQIPAEEIQEEPENELIEKALIFQSDKISNCIVTYYCACEKCCGKYADGITATGTKASNVTCAVDPKVIPLGATVMIDYDLDGNIDDYRIAEDTGGFKGNHIDVFCVSHETALQMGRKTADVYWVVEQ